MPVEAEEAMTERRLYAPELPDGGGAVELDAGASRHVRVLRLRSGDRVQLFDGKGATAQAVIQAIDERVMCEAEAPSLAPRRSARLVLLLGIPKGSTLDDCVRMATELGVDEIALLQAERSVPRWDGARALQRVERLTRVAAEAAAQCERADLPLIHPPRSCSEWLDALPAGAQGVLFAARAEGALRLEATPEQVWCTVGPEGGFSSGELAALERAGFIVASLGSTVLRVDTAVVAGLGVIQDRLQALQAR